MKCPYHEKVELLPSVHTPGVVICQSCKREKVKGRDGIFEESKLSLKTTNELFQNYTKFGRNSKVDSGAIIKALRSVYKYSFDEALELVRNLERNGEMTVRNEGNLNDFQESLNDDGCPNLPIKIIALFDE